MPLFFDFQYLLFIAPFLLLGMWAAFRVKSTFAHFQRFAVSSGMTGAQAAAAVARAGGADVKIERVGGFLSDHYDPRTKTLRLSPDVYDGRSISAVAVGAHEAGHAIQDVKEYAWLNFRSAMVPAVQFGNSLWFWPVLIGLLTGISGFLLVGILLLAVTVLFQVVTLPVEYDASARAKAVLAEAGIVASEDERRGVAKVLNAAALTYVAGALTSIMTLLYYVMIFLGSRE